MLARTPKKIAQTPAARKRLERKRIREGLTPLLIDVHEVNLVEHLERAADMNGVQLISNYYWFATKDERRAM